MLSMLRISDKPLTYLSKQLARIKRFVKYTILDLQYGSWYLGAKLKTIGMGDNIRGWHPAQSSDYDALSTMFSQVDINENDVIVDVGCGRGRLFNFLLHKGFKNKMIGLEVDQAIAKFTRNRLKKYNQVEIIVTDIEENNSLPENGTIFYLFNPFTDRIVKKFADQLAEKIRNKQFKQGRPIVIYYNCQGRLYIFDDSNLWKIKKLGLLSHTKLETAIIEAV